MATLIAPPASQAEIVYVALRDGWWRVYVQSDLGTSPRSVATRDVAGDPSAPALSSDKRLVAMEVGGAIVVCPVAAVAECEHLRSPRGPAVRPAWHPVSSELVFGLYVADSREEDSDILITRNGRRDMASLLAQTGSQDDPAFSPDGRQVAYTVSQTVSVHQAGVQVIQQVWLADTVSGLVRQVLAGSARDVNPAWSPSGRVIAFGSDRTGDFEIWTVGVDGSGLRRLTSGPGAKTRPRWSPDGKSIMFTMAREGRLSLWIIDEDGSNLRQFEPFGPNADVQLRDADWR